MAYATIREDRAVSLTSIEAAILGEVDRNPGIVTHDLRAAVGLTEDVFAKTVHDLAVRGFLISIVASYASGWRITEQGRAEL